MEDRSREPAASGLTQTISGLRMNNPSSQSIALALESATGNYNVGASLFRQISVPREDHGRDPQQRFACAIRLAVPAVTNLALSIELLLKAHHFQSSGVYPKGHDIAFLGMQFAEDQLATLRANYERNYNDSSIDKTLEFRMTTFPPGDAWDRQAVSSYDLAIRYIGEAYKNWRYIYEEFREGMNASITFAPLYCVATSVLEATQAFKGSQRVVVVDRLPNKAPESTRE